MNDNIPRSVVIAVRAAAADVVSSIKGANYKAVKADDSLVKTIESFLMGMVAPHFPTTKFQWVDSTLDGKWVTAAEGNMVDIKKLDDAMNQKYKGLSEQEVQTLKRDNITRLVCKTLEEFRKINPELYELYQGGAMPSDSPLGLEAPMEEAMPKLPPMDLPQKETPLPKDTKDGEPPSKQKLAKPGEVSVVNPIDDEFEGVPPKTI